MCWQNHGKYTKCKHLTGEYNFLKALGHTERDQLISCLAALKLNVQLWASQEEKLNKRQAHSQNITCYKNKYRTIHNCHNSRRKSETLYLTQNKQQKLQILPSKFVSFLSCRVTFHSDITLVFFPRCSLDHLFHWQIFLTRNETNRLGKIWSLWQLQ